MGTTKNHIFPFVLSLSFSRLSALFGISVVLLDCINRLKWKCSAKKKCVCALHTYIYATRIGTRKECIRFGVKNATLYQNFLVAMHTPQPLSFYLLFAFSLVFAGDINTMYIWANCKPLSEHMRCHNMNRVCVWFICIQFSNVVMSVWRAA